MTGLRTTLVCCMLAFAGNTGAAELGRLFFTPAQRALLDNARQQNIRIELGNDGEQQQAAPVPQNVSVTGLVQRSDGRSTVFLDGKPYAAREVRAQELLEPRIVDRRDPPRPAPAPSPARAREGS